MSELTVSKNVVVGLAYTLYVDGAIEDNAPASAPLEYLHGRGNLIPGMETQIEGMKVGEKKQITVDPADGYGEHDPEGVIPLDRGMFPEGYPLHKGHALQLTDDEGHHFVGYIQDWDDATVTVDMNHPMAGKTLVFDVEIVSLREGTDEEIMNGSLESHHGCDCGCDDCGSGCGGCSGGCH